MVEDVQQKVSKAMGNEKYKTEDISSTNLGIDEMVLILRNILMRKDAMVY